MPIEIPQLDNRDYADILQEALARIPVHTPEWTNFNDSDPGVTLVQLFAFMTESILYRANQIPERNRRKFLQLLGIPLMPAATAQGFVTITNERGPLATRRIPDGLDVRAGQVRFRTTKLGFEPDKADLEVLPITGEVFYKRPVNATPAEKNLYRELYADLLSQGEMPKFYETAPMPSPKSDGTLPVLSLSDTVDDCLWIALLARRGDDLTNARSKLVGEQAKILTVGVMPYQADTGISVAAGLTRRAETTSPVVWEIPIKDENSLKFETLKSRSFTSILHTPGLVELTLPNTLKELTWDVANLSPGLDGTGNYPPSLADTDLADRLITWIRLRVKQPKDINNQDTQSIKARFSWIGINATQVLQQVRVKGEVLGNGSGEPDQVFQLAHAPVLPDTLELWVNGERWSVIDDLLAADPEVPVKSPRYPVYESAITKSLITKSANKATTKQKLRHQVFSLDPESGLITFGDGAHGTRPPLRKRIVANYAYGGGRLGNVGIDAINASPGLPAGYKVTNPIRTWGGDDAEDTAKAERGISRYVKHRDRLVSVQDFEEITHQTPGVDMGRVSVMPLFDPNPPTASNVPGAVTVMVIPNSNQNNAPQPDSFFLEAVCNHLQPRRLVTTDLHVRGPKYKEVWVSVGIELLGGYGASVVQENVRQALLTFLSPLRGGPQAKGWPLNVKVLPKELEAVVARVEGVRLVNSPFYLESKDDISIPEIPMEGLELPKLVGISVTTGQPVSIGELKGNLKNTPDLSKWKPIPVLPERC